MIYENHLRNHVVYPGREEALETFLKHPYKWGNRLNSHSEDALTWSCFDAISQLPFSKKIKALDEILEDSFNDEKSIQSFFTPRINYMVTEMIFIYHYPLLSDFLIS